MIYFSLGDQESHTKNPYLAPVEENTRFLAQYFSEQGIRTTFQLNRGNHYRNSTGRMAAGIQWVLHDSCRKVVLKDMGDWQESRIMN